MPIPKQVADYEYVIASAAYQQTNLTFFRILQQRYVSRSYRLVANRLVVL